MKTQTGCSRRHFFRAGLASAAVACGAAGRTADSRGVESIDVGTDRQLFLDDRLLDLERTHGVTRRLNPPENIHRVLKPDQPWEALGFIFYASVVDDEGVVKLFHGSYDAEKKKHFGLATSRDGLHWERSRLGLKEFQGSKENCILPIAAVEACVFLDPHARPEKHHRLLYTSHWPDPARAGVYVASSGDGIHWVTTPDRLLPFVPDSQPSAVWDDALKQYVIYLRAWNPRRSVARIAVSDLESPWPYDRSIPAHHVWGKDKIATLSRELPTVMAPDEQDPENLHLYTSAVVGYPFAPNVYLAFPAAYLTYNGPDWQSRALNGNDGTFEVQLATSRDGIAWNRWRRPYVAAGFHDGLDLRLVSMGQGMVRRGRLLHQYFVGWPHTHGRPVVWDRDLKNRAEWLKKDRGGIYVATQRVDGFLSMDAAYSGGVLTTRPLRFAGNHLCLNVHTAGSGHAKVAMLDADGAAIPGFTAADCDVIHSDAIDYRVQWRRGADFGSLAGRSVRVQISMRNTKLYAMQAVPGARLPRRCHRHRNPRPASSARRH